MTPALLPAHEREKNFRWLEPIFDRAINEGGCEVPLNGLSMQDCLACIVNAKLSLKRDKWKTRLDLEKVSQLCAETKEGRVYVNLKINSDAERARHKSHTEMNERNILHLHDPEQADLVAVAHLITNRQVAMCQISGKFDLAFAQQLHLSYDVVLQEENQTWTLI